jgi:hypothetical protein
MGREFHDLLFSLPFQVPQDFILLTRAVGILTGLVTSIDPEFDPWREIGPFARELARESDLATGPLPPKIAPRDLLDWRTLRDLLSAESFEQLRDAGVDYAVRAARLPLLAERVLQRADRGDLSVLMTPSSDLSQEVTRVERGLARLADAVVFAGCAISGAVLTAAGEPLFGAVGFVLAGLALLRILWRGG